MTYELKTRSNSRSRMFLGGTYFRSKDVGVDKNNISLECVKWGDDHYLVVVNHNTTEENISGPVTYTILEQELDWHEYIEITNLQTVPTAQIYSISSQIAVGTNLGNFYFDKLFFISGKVSAKLALKNNSLENDKITIKPNYRMYKLQPLSVTSADGTISEGWDIQALRSIFDNPWVEMPERGFDKQDELAEDAPILSLFDKTYLKGGDGIPNRPVGLLVGDDISMVHISTDEDREGSPTSVNKVLIWQNNQWQNYT